MVKGELFPQPHVEEIESIGITLNDIPESTCDECGTLMKKIYMVHDFGGVEVRFRSQKVPGYRCPQDGDFFSWEGVLASLTKACDLLKTQGNMVEAEIMNDSVKFTKRQSEEAKKEAGIVG